MDGLNNQLNRKCLIESITFLLNRWKLILMLDCLHYVFADFLIMKYYLCQVLHVLHSLTVIRCAVLSEGL